MSKQRIQNFIRKAATTTKLEENVDRVFRDIKNNINILFDGPELTLSSSLVHSGSFVNVGNVEINGSVGIGTDSPSAKLHVEGSGFNAGKGLFKSTDSGNSIEINGLDGAGINDIAYLTLTNAGSDTSFIGLVGTAGGGNVGDLRFYVGGNERLRIDTAGQVGIGTNNPESALEINSTGISVLNIHSTTSGNSAAIELGTGGTGDRQAYIDFVGDDNYTDYGLRIIRGSGGDANSIIANRGVGSLILLAEHTGSIKLATNNTDRMIVDSNGRVGIGTNNPTTTLEVNSTSVATLAIHSTTSATDASIELGTGGSGNRYAFIDFVGDDTYTDYGLRIIRNNNGANADSVFAHRGTGGLIFDLPEAGEMVFKTSGTERMRIKSTGRVGIGTDTPLTLLHLSKDQDAVSTSFLIENLDQRVNISSYFESGVIQYGSISSQQDSGSETNLVLQPGGGSVGIGTTSPSYKLDVTTDLNGYIARFFNDGNNANRSGIIVQCGADDGSGGTVYFLGKDGDGTDVGYIENNGGTFGIIDISDERVKKDIAPTKINGLDIIKNIVPIEFKYKRQGDSAKLHECGFSAQNLKNVFPEAVSENKETGMYGVSRAALIPVLVKALKEQQEMIELLETRVQSLELKINVE